MTPSQIMVKPAFIRLTPSEKARNLESGYTKTNGYTADSGIYDSPYGEVITPLDCMREYDSNAHKILSQDYYPDPVSEDKYIDSEGKEQKRFYRRKVARVTVDLIQMFHTQRTSILTGSNTDLRMVNKRATAEERKLLSAFREGWEEKNMENARYELISRAGKTMDAAICGYMADGRFMWRAFSYESGDTLYEHKDPMTGEMALFGRRYVSVGMGDTEPTEYLDVWDKTYYMRYRKDKEQAGDENEGWVVDAKPERHNFPMIPVSYVRYGETFWGNAIHPVDELEKDLSQLLENNKQYGLRILVALGDEMEVKATFDGRPMQINGPADGKVNYLEPADASNSFMTSMRALEDQAYIAANCVKQAELKSGSDISSLTVKMLNQPLYRKAILDAFIFQPAIDRLVEIYKYGYSVEMKMESQLRNFKIKARTYPYVMMSENEEVANVTALKASGALSQQSAAEEAYNLGYGSVDEPERLLQEEHDKLVAESLAKGGEGMTEEEKGLAGGNKNNPVNEARKALSE